MAGAGGPKSPAPIPGDRAPATPSHLPQRCAVQQWYPPSRAAESRELKTAEGGPPAPLVRPPRLALTRPQSVPQKNAFSSRQIPPSRARFCRKLTLRACRGRSPLPQRCAVQQWYPPGHTAEKRIGDSGGWATRLFIVLTWLLSHEVETCFGL